MFIGTQASNLADMREKGRGVFPPAPPIGSSNPRAKLTDDDIRVIRLRHSLGESFNSISKHYGVYATTISDIVKRHTWNHIT
jgi:predicted DNA-binding protein (UPF0251 family)